VLARLTVKIEVLGVARVLVDDLSQIGSDILQPIAGLRGLSVMPQGLDVDRGTHKPRSVRRTLLPNDSSPIVHYHGLTTARVGKITQLPLASSLATCGAIHAVTRARVAPSITPRCDRTQRAMR
jgi:hypothetical protein